MDILRCRRELHVPDRDRAHLDADNVLTYDRQRPRVLCGLHAHCDPPLLTLTQLVHAARQHVAARHHLQPTRRLALEPYYVITARMITNVCYKRYVYCMKCREVNLAQQASRNSNPNTV